MSQNPVVVHTYS